MIKSLLVPLDGSEASEKALPWAIDLAAKLQAEIILLRVGREPNFLEGQDLMSLENFMSKQEQSCREYLLRVKAELKGQAYVNVWVEYAYGQPSREIVAKAAQLNASMIVMNSHGRDGLARWWMGSVAEKVTRHSHCPVLLVRQSLPDEKGDPRERQPAEANQ
ncbi:MAG: universal stress protein [Vulcanimicrobiota bacterium]